MRAMLTLAAAGILAVGFAGNVYAGGAATCAQIQSVCGTDISEAQDGSDPRCAGNGAPTDAEESAKVNGCIWDGSSDSCIGGDGRPDVGAAGTHGCLVVGDVITFDDGDPTTPTGVGTGNDAEAACVTFAESGCAEDGD